MHKLFDLDHPFFRPLWVRIAVTLSCLAWGALEFILGNPFWGTLFAGLGAYCAWAFFIDRRPPVGTENKKD